MTAHHPTAIAVCPACEGLLALPAGASPQAQCLCPLCNGQFALAAAQRNLPQARIVQPVAAPTSPAAASEVAAPRPRRSAPTERSPRRRSAATVLGAALAGLAVVATAAYWLLKPPANARVAARPTVREEQPAAHATQPAAPSVDRDVVPAAAELPLGSTPVEEPAVPVPRLPATLPPPRKTVSWPVTPMIADLNDAQLVSFDELAAAVARGEAAAQTFAGSSLSDTAAVRSLGKAYAELCALAEAFMLTDPAAYGGKLFTQQALAKTALRSAAAASRRKDLNVVAARWLQHERRPHQGVVFTARVLDLRARGAWTEYDLEIDYGSQTLRVAALLDKVKFGAGAEVGVIGLILPDPQRQLAGYDGDAAPLILVGDAFHPAKAAEAVGAPDEFELMAQ